MILLILAILVITIIVIMYIDKKYNQRVLVATTQQAAVTPPATTESAPGSQEKLTTPDPRSYFELTDGEKIQYIIDNYFLSPEELSEKVVPVNIQAENAYIKTLPTDSSTCSDGFTECEKWANDGECMINPEFMLYKCPKSCKACALNEQEKFNLVKIFDGRPPHHCVFHGRSEKYPGPDHYLRKFDQYSNDNLLL